MVAFLALILVAVALQAVSYLMMPKAKRAKPEAARDLEDPTADASKPIGIVFGTLTIKDPNVLWFGDKSSRTYTVNV